MKVVTASEIFDFIGNHPELTIEKHVLVSSEFSLLRRGIRHIVFMLRDSDDEFAMMAVSQLRRALSEWLTMPIQFDKRMQILLEENLGDRCTIQRRWGSDLFEYYETAWVAAQSLSGIENPMRAAVLKEIRALRTDNSSFQIYCHRRAREHFESIINLSGDIPLQESDFLHSEVDYEAARPADSLIKVGPFRAMGYGKIPDSIVNAPRFTTIHQYVWSACEDDKDFGFDPASTDVPAIVHDNEHMTKPEATKPHFVWRIKLLDGGSPIDKGGEIKDSNDDEDDLLLLRDITRTSDRRLAILVQLDNAYGVLYPRFSNVLSFNPDEDRATSIGVRLAWEGLQEGMYAIFPIELNVDLGELRAEYGYFSRIWRGRLEEEWRTNPDALEQSLQMHGLKLIHLPAAIRHWIMPPDTVIHAPQSLEHFRILMDVLNCEVEHRGANMSHDSRPFWEQAWLEIRRSRGEAIQAGFQEQEIVEEEVINTLKSMMHEIERLAETNERFLITLPRERGIHGSLQFYRIQAIEDGYSAPHSDLRIIRELTNLDIWRE